MSYQNHVHDGVEYELELNLTSSTGTYLRTSAARRKNGTAARESRLRMVQEFECRRRHLVLVGEECVGGGALHSLSAGSH